MSADLIVSYDGTPNDDDALALGRLLARAGATLALAYIRHAREFDPRRGAWRIEITHKLADRQPLERSLRRFRQTIEKIADRCPLAIVATDVRQRVLHALHLEHHFLDRDSIGIAARDQAGPVAADFLDQLRVFELPQNARHLRVGRAKLFRETV